MPSSQILPIESSRLYLVVLFLLYTIWFSLSVLEICATSLMDFGLSSLFHVLCWFNLERRKTFHSTLLLNDNFGFISSTTTLLGPSSMFSPT